MDGSKHLDKYDGQTHTYLEQDDNEIKKVDRLNEPTLEVNSSDFVDNTMVIELECADICWVCVAEETSSRLTFQSMIASPRNKSTSCTIYVRKE